MFYMYANTSRRIAVKWMMRFPKWMTTLRTTKLTTKMENQKRCASPRCHRKRKTTPTTCEGHLPEARIICSFEEGVNKVYIFAWSRIEKCDKIATLCESSTKRTP